MKTKRKQRTATTAAVRGTTGKQRYSALLAYDEPVYGTLDFEAANDAAAARQGRRILDQWDTRTTHVCFETEHEGADQYRIVYLKNRDTKEIVAEDIHLNPPRPKVLIHVHGGVATYSVAGGDVDVALVDVDNIDAGDPPVELDQSWRALIERSFAEECSQYVRFVKVKRRS